MMLTQANLIWLPLDCTRGRRCDDGVSRNSICIVRTAQAPILFSCNLETNIYWWIFSFYPIYSTGRCVVRLSSQVKCHEDMELVRRTVDRLALVHPFCELKCIYASDSRSAPNWKYWKPIIQLMVCSGAYQICPADVTSIESVSRNGRYVSIQDNCVVQDLIAPRYI